jgi:starch synthase (maltosyl-transferring)
VWPSLDGGRYPVKRVVGDEVEVSATIFRDGHEVLGAAVRCRAPGEPTWRESPMVEAEPGTDRWLGSFVVDTPGRWELTIVAWVDRVASWRWELERKVEAGQTDLASELLEGAALLGVGSLTVEEGLAASTPVRSEPTELPDSLVVDVDRELAVFGSWYELFPRSWGGFAGVTRVLPALGDLGFDVVYLPPIHPIGLNHRKGRNNAPVAEPGDPGSPWAIGSFEGGHTAVHPDLGTMEEFEAMVARGSELGVEVALDVAFQCSPDHPWLAEHPEWFYRRPDGTLKYAENPPKRYQDIYSLDLGCEDWRALWDELLGVVLDWVARGVRIFRVDNPHTKPFGFWEWLIGEVRTEHPDVVFLAEAFTRRALMYTLAKLGFTQSYTYFTWNNTKAELTEYLTELTRVDEYFRPNFFTNTPDILHGYLQRGGRPAFEARLVLAATLSPSYGIYSGFESCENVPLREGSEEYMDSEKYEIKERRLDGELLPLVATLNRIRRENPALQRFANLRLLETGDEELFAYAKREGENVIVVCVNLDPFGPREDVMVLGSDLGLPPVFEATELLTGERVELVTGRNDVRLDPADRQALVMRVDTAEPGS